MNPNIAIGKELDDLAGLYGLQREMESDADLRVRVCDAILARKPDHRFTLLYDRIVRRFWADGEPMSEAEFRQMAWMEELHYPENRSIRMTDEDVLKIARIER